MDTFIVNTSKTYDSHEIEGYIPAFNKFIAGDFAPAWGTGGTVTFIGETVPAEHPGGLLVVVQDPTPADGQNDLGYHVNDQGHATSYIFAQVIKSCGASLSQVIMHEILEALADPLCNQFVVVNTRTYIREVCDPVEETMVIVDGVECSNFVMPLYFGFAGAAGVYDFNRQLHAPAPALLPGGYILELDTTRNVWVGHYRFMGPTLSWHQLHNGRSHFRRSKLLAA